MHMHTIPEAGMGRGKNEWHLSQGQANVGDHFEVLSSCTCCTVCISELGKVALCWELRGSLKVCLLSQRGEQNEMDLGSLAFAIGTTFEQEGLPKNPLQELARLISTPTRPDS